MKVIPFSLTLMILFAACNNTPPNTKAGGSTMDSQARKVDTVKAHKVVVQDIQLETMEDEENPDTILHRTIAGYKQPYLLDTGFNINGSVLQLHLKHYCLMDSAIRVPKRYVEIYKLDSFVTHNFVTRIKVDKDGRTILERTVYTKDFAQLLFPQLDTFGVLSYPYVNRLNDTLLVHYSLSIPLTDVGKAVTMLIRPDGDVAFIDNPAY